MPELKDSTHKDNTTIDHQSALSSLQNSFYRQITTTPNSNPHFHNSFEIQYAINEPVNVHLDKDTYVLEKGHFAMILPNQIHWCTASPAALTHAMIFSINYTPGIEKLTHNMNGSSPLFECSEDVVALLESSFFNRNNDQIFTKGILYTICSFYISQVTLSPREYTPNTGFMEESLKYITDGYTENITLLKLAEMLGYEYHYTSRLFHQNFKINFKYYVNCYRMNLAFDLLTNTNKKNLGNRRPRRLRQHPFLQ